MFKSIVVGTDGSATAAEAVRQAAEVASRFGARLHIVSAYKPVSEVWASPEVMPVSVSDLIDPHQDARQACDEAGSIAEAAGVEPEVHARPGDAAEAVISVAEEQGADLIVVGNRGMTSKARFLLGSVPNKVSHHAPCTVMIVRTCG